MAEQAMPKDDGMDTIDDDPSSSDNAVLEYDDASMVVVHAMMEACTAGNLTQAQAIVEALGDGYASMQVESTGWSPLMAAAHGGHIQLCQYLLEQGAPWNAMDRRGQCAGNLATDQEHWEIVNLLVEWGTRAELILGRIEREQRRRQVANNNSQAVGNNATTMHGGTTTTRPVEHEPSTKPDYLRQRLQYTADGQSLLDADEDAVMMEWERPLMKAHAEILMESSAVSSLVTAASTTTLSTTRPSKRVLNVGFGMGIIDSALQDWQPAHHIIIEAHPDVYQRMIDTGWTQRSNVRVCFGTWQEVMPQLIAEGTIVDAIFYDTVSPKEP
jgi:type IV protein arginine methyltransferase